jgi:hypothetical protein
MGLYTVITYMKGSRGRYNISHWSQLTVKQHHQADLIIWNPTRGGPSVIVKNRWGSHDKGHKTAFRSTLLEDLGLHTGSQGCMDGVVDRVSVCSGNSSQEAEEKMAEPFEVFVAYETTSEFGHLGAVLGIFTTKSGALKAAKGNGFYGGDGAYRVAWAIHVPYSGPHGFSFDPPGKTYLLDSKVPITLDVSLPEHREKLRSAALAKLSAEERDALGLK